MEPEADVSIEDEADFEAAFAKNEREIIRADDPVNLEDELPPPAFTKNLLARFKSMEDLNRPPPTPELDLAVKKVLKEERKKELDPNRRKSSPAGMFGHQLKLAPEDIKQIDHDEQQSERQQPEGGEYANGHAEFVQYEGQAESGDFENTPTKAGDVLRESDSFMEEEMPEAGITRNLLAKFQSMTNA